MKEAYTYRGHSIALNLAALEHGRVRWTYFIDQDYCIQDTSVALPIDTVRNNALALAHRSIDTLDSIKSVGQWPTGVKPVARSAASNREPMKTSMTVLDDARPSARAPRSSPVEGSVPR